MQINFPKHYVRFGRTVEQQVLAEYSHTFEGVVFNGNTLAYFGRFLSTFIHIKTKQKSFFIDPLTHSFQHPLDKISDEKQRIKTSIKKLIEHYGEPLKTIVLNTQRPIQPKDFTDEIIESFVKNVLEFQQKHLFESTDKDIKDYIEEFKDLFTIEPIFLVSPYFYLDIDDNRVWDWLKLNEIFISVSRKIKGERYKIFGELAISKEFFDKMMENEELYHKVISSYSEADGVLLWIDNFDEHTESENRLKGLKDFVTNFKKDKFSDKILINLYGGYFSELLLKFGLDGVVHGPDYGEFRPIVPVGGGIPTAKFYFPPLKNRLPTNNVLWILQYLDIKTKQDYYEKVCSCPVCKKNIGQNPKDDFLRCYGKTMLVEIKGRYGTQAREYPDMETLKNSLAHYLEAKREEFDRIEQSSVEKLIEELRTCYEEYKGNLGLEEKDIKHLDIWIRILQGDGE